MRDTSGGVEKGRGPEASGISMEGAGVSIEGAGDGGIVGVGVGAGAGTTCTGGASSVIGTTVADPGIISGVVDRDSLTGSGRNVIEASDQLINGLMRLSPDRKENRDV